MANLIDATYFKGEILLTNKTDLATVYDDYITKYEKEILISLLGYKLYSLMITNQSSEPYKSLIEGAEFELTFDGITQTIKWEGLKNSIKESLIAYYVYYRYQEEQFLMPGAIGTVKPIAEAAEVISPYSKMVSAWNKMLQLYGYYPGVWFKYTHAKIVQPDGTLIYDDYPSAYNYLCANITDFPDWIFTPLKPINIFGI